MKIELRHRHYGVHELIKECEIYGSFNEYCTLISGDDYKINEQKLINNLPDKFLPVDPKYILVSIQNDKWGTGQMHLDIFRTWAKYFDSYVLDIIKD